MKHHVQSLSIYQSAPYDNDTSNDGPDHLKYPFVVRLSSLLSNVLLISINSIRRQKLLKVSKLGHIIIAKIHKKMHISRSSCIAKTCLQSTAKTSRRRRRENEELLHNRQTGRVVDSQAHKGQPVARQNGKK